MTRMIIQNEGVFQLGLRKLFLYLLLLVVTAFLGYWFIGCQEATCQAGWFVGLVKFLAWPFFMFSRLPDMHLALGIILFIPSVILQLIWLYGIACVLLLPWRGRRYVYKR
ncbi:hypothetical protein CMO91_05760 [Candidatus Woesearchaeota archaeon]|mgnify:CR=1 FL=1|nr:hypothetical protein [Candidatus Woesearchaeota archaeon]|tara:strand:- start:1832 stop:2161 length:330 start_codon:yes stop_codon:yes gene_type:complete